MNSPLTLASQLGTRFQDQRLLRSERAGLLREGTISGVQDRYNLSVPSVFCVLLGRQPCRKINEISLLIQTVNRRVPGSSPGRGANPPESRLALHCEGCQGQNSRGPRFVC